MKELQFPLIRISLFFVLGILLYPYITFTFIQLFLVSTIVLLAFVFFIYTIKLLKYSSAIILTP